MAKKMGKTFVKGRYKSSKTQKTKRKSKHKVFHVSVYV